MCPPSAPLAVGLGALRTSVGDSVHLVSTCQDTVFLALALVALVTQNRKRTREELQNEIDNLVNWTEKWQMEFNASMHGQV